MEKEIQEAMREAIQNTLKKYLLPDCLKPEFDGITLCEIAAESLKEAEKARNIERINSPHDCKMKEKGFCETCFPHEEEHQSVEDVVEIF